MRAMRVVSAICVTLLLGSCAELRMFPQQSTLKCPRKCDMKISVDRAGEIDLPYRLEVSAKPTRIYWHLPDGYEFDTTQGDGIYLKGPNDGEFSEMFETDDDNDSTGAGRRRAPRFHWRDANSKPNAFGYEYRIQFRKSGSTKPLFKDPIIINSG